jgi:hypothetical protein
MHSRWRTAPAAAVLAGLRGSHGRPSALANTAALRLGTFGGRNSGVR